MERSGPAPTWGGRLVILPLISLGYTNSTHAINSAVYAPAAKHASLSEFSIECWFNLLVEPSKS